MAESDYTGRQERVAPPDNAPYRSVTSLAGWKEEFRIVTKEFVSPITAAAGAVARQFDLRTGKKSCD